MSTSSLPPLPTRDDRRGSGWSFAMIRIIEHTLAAGIVLFHLVLLALERPSNREE